MEAYVLMMQADEDAKSLTESILEEIYFANRVPLSLSGLVQQKFFKIVGHEPKYNFTYASSIVGIAHL